MIGRRHVVDRRSAISKLNEQAEALAEPLTAAAVKANLGSVERIPPGQGRAFRVLGLTIAVFRNREGTIFATQASCPHKGGPLADGLLGQRTLICPLHACGFDVCSGEPAGHSYGSLKTYPVTISHGQIFVTLE